MKLKNNITSIGIDKQDNCLEKSSKKTNKKLLKLIESGDMVSIIKKLQKKQEELFKIYEEEGGSDNFFKKAKKWIEKVNFYLDHRGKAYLFEFGGGESYNRCIVGLSMDKKGVTLQYVAPYQYNYQKIKDRNKDSDSVEKDIECLFALDIGKQAYNISY